MCALLLLLMVGAADCVRTLPLLQGYPQDFVPQPYQYDVPPLLSRAGLSDGVVKTNRPTYGKEGLERQPEFQEKHVSKLLTSVNCSRGSEQRDHGVKNNENDREETTRKLFQDSGTRRNYKEMTRHGGRHTEPLVNKVNPTIGAEDEQEAAWVWGSSDTVDIRGRSSGGNLDDRTAISGANCPTGSIKLEGKCVETH